jgi:hypothetical protein
MDAWACFLGGSANTHGARINHYLINKAATMAQRKKRQTARKGKPIARGKARKPAKSARKKPVKRTVARATPRKRPAKAKLKGVVKKARKRVKVVKPPSTPVVETDTEIEATEVREVSGAPEQPEESRSAPPESEGQ